MVRIIAILIVLLFVSVKSGEVIERFSVDKDKGIYPKIVTPKSSTLTIEVTAPDNSNVGVPSGKIYDITGKEIGAMRAEGDFFTPPYKIFMKWVATEDIQSGVYIYQLDSNGQYYNGTFVVAR